MGNRKIGVEVGGSVGRVLEFLLFEVDPGLDVFEDFLLVEVEVDLDHVLESFGRILEHLVHGKLDGSVFDDILVADIGAGQVVILMSLVVCIPRLLIDDIVAHHETLDGHEYVHAGG